MIVHDEYVTKKLDNMVSPPLLIVLVRTPVAKLAVALILLHAASLFSDPAFQRLIQRLT